jgi:hypothetical protein
MSRPIPAGDYVEHFDPDLDHHRGWLLAVLEHLVAHEPQALEEGGTLRSLRTAHQAGVAPSPAPALPLPAPTPKPPVVINGWKIYAHPLFINQLEALIAEVKTLRSKEPKV